MAQAVVHDLETIQIQEQHCELIILVLLGTLDDELQILGQQGAIRQIGQRVMKSGVTKVFLAFL